MSRNEERAEAARKMGHEIGDMLYEKQLAYGDSGAIALGLWIARLAQYRVSVSEQGFVAGDRLTNPDENGSHYLIPVELIAHIPRITRLDDRINRIISNPAGDRMGEDPWRDAAGDSIIGAIAPRFPRSEREEWDRGAAEAAAIADRVLASHRQPLPICPEPECERPWAHDGPHKKVDAAGVHEWETGSPRRFHAVAFGDGFREDAL